MEATEQEQRSLGRKKSGKLGVSVASSTDIEDLKEFYELNCITKQSLGVPCHPWEFFKIYSLSLTAM